MVIINGKTYHQINVHERVKYNISVYSAPSRGSLVDRGEIGGLSGSYVRIVHPHTNPRRINVSGIDSRQVTYLPIVTVGGGVPSYRGDVIAITHQCS